MENLSANKFLEAVAVDLAAARIENPTIEQIQDAMRSRLERDYDNGCWLIGKSEAARTMRNLMGTLVFVDCHRASLGERLVR